MKSARRAHHSDDEAEEAPAQPASELPPALEAGEDHPAAAAFRVDAPDDAASPAAPSPARAAAAESSGSDSEGDQTAARNETRGQALQRHKRVRASSIELSRPFNE